MSKSIRAKIKPELLIWARESIGLSIEDAAKKIAVKEDQLEKWERGEAYPTITQLRKASNVYKRPLAVFYLPEPPLRFEPMKLHDYRTMYSLEKGPLSPELLWEIRKAHQRREDALELIQELDEEVPSFNLTASVKDGPVHIANRIRETLNVSLENQKAWTDNNEALRSWKAAIERLGVFIFQTTSVDIMEMRGFSVSHEKFPVIVLNPKDSPAGRVFTLIHELTHLILNNSGICDLREHEHVSAENQRAEIFCNNVAGTALVPTESLLSEKIVVDNEPTHEWSDTELKRLANSYSVSSEVILRRLLTLGRTTPEYYERKRQEFIDFYRKLSQKKASGGPPYHIRLISYNGHSFTRLVLNAYYQEKITSRDVSDYLGMNLKHLKRVENSL